MQSQPGHSWQPAPSRSPILRCVSVGSRWLACPAPNPICICPTDRQLLPVFRIYPGASLMLEARSRAAVQMRLDCMARRGVHGHNVSTVDPSVSNEIAGRSLCGLTGLGPVTCKTHFGHHTSSEIQNRTLYTITTRSVGFVLWMPKMGFGVS
jgi:hypothetical protein